MTRELTWPGIPPLEPGDLLAADKRAREVRP